MNQTTVEKIQAEQRWQTEKWGGGQFAHMTPERVLAVLTEEVGEVAQAVLNLAWQPAMYPDNARRRRERLEAEIIQVAAVAAAWLDDCFTDEEGVPPPGEGR